MTETDNDKYKNYLSKNKYRFVQERNLHIQTTSSIAFQPNYNNKRH